MPPLLPPTSSLPLAPFFYLVSSGFFGAELVSNFHDYFCFPFLALVALSLLPSFPYLPSSFPPFCHETRLNPAVRAICSRTYLYFIIAEVFTLCPPQLFLPLTLVLPLTFSLALPLICSHVYYMIFIATPSAGESAYYYSVMRQRNEEEGGEFSLRHSRARYARTILSGVFSRPVRDDAPGVTGEERM